MKSPFQHHDLKIVDPPFNSSLTDIILDLEKLRKKYISGTTPPYIFFQLKRIFHSLESLGSARIEGNRTRILDLLEEKLEASVSKPENIREIDNIEKALDFIDEHIDSHPINRFFLAELHKCVVSNLTAEGDLSPGEYRQQNVVISNSEHTPPDYVRVCDYMDELFNFINKDDPPKYALLKMAIAHHRFTWIHPFTNGNGRTVRLLSYAMLLKQKFDVRKGGRILNPTAVFCNDRNTYYQYLSLADTGDDNNILLWCEYVLRGLRDEIEKIDQLLHYEFLKEKILYPAIELSLERKIITIEEQVALKLAVEETSLSNNKLRAKLKDKYTSQTSLRINALKEKGMLIAFPDNKYLYTIQFTNNYLLRSIVAKLIENDFITVQDDSTKEI
ncbi:MAG: Fic family protein [Candidatus Auribacterota bacterium]